MICDECKGTGTVEWDGICDGCRAYPDGVSYQCNCREPQECECTDCGGTGEVLEVSA